MNADDLRIRELEAEVERLYAELARAAAREQDLTDTRRAMLYLLEDINEGTALTEKARKEWEAIFDSISDLIYVHDAQMRIVRCNRAYKDAASMKFKEIIGRPYFEVFPRMDGPFDLCVNDPGGAKNEGEVQDIDDPSSSRVFRLKVYPLHESGSGGLFIHVMENITNEKTAEEALRRSEDKYRHLFDNLRDAAFLADAGSGSIIETNKAGEVLLGRTRAEIIGLNQREMHPPGKAGEYARMFADAVRRRVADYEGEVVRKDGTKVAVAISGEAVEIGGRRLLLGIFRDITEQKANEEKIALEMELNKRLLMISNATAHTVDIERMMEQVAGCLHKIMRSDMGLSYLWDPEMGSFVSCRASGLSNEQVPLFTVERLYPEGGFISRALKERRTIIENFGPEYAMAHGQKAASGAPEADGRTGGPVSGEAPLRWAGEVSTAVVFPLIGRSGCLGLLMAVYAGGKAPPEFGKRDREVWDGISYQVSTALDEARLYKDSIDRTMELSRKVETIQTMHDIDTAILSAVHIDAILDTAARMVGKAVLCDRTSIALVDREREGFTYAAGYGTDSLKKGAFIDFRDTSATEVVKTGIPQYVADLKAQGHLLPLEKKFSEEGFVSHIRVPLIVKGDAVGVLVTGSKRVAAFSAEDLSILEKLASQIGIALENARLLSDIEELFIGTVKTLSEAIDAKSPWTRGHSERVTAIALEIARELGLGDEEIKRLELAGLLHDIGKLGTYEYILDKPGRLTDEELEIMRLHPKKGAEILAPIKQLSDICPIIRHHHEYFDGTGYPDGLKQEEIPPMSRILTVADTVDAMGADRPYRKGKPMAAIIAELERCSGTQFDPEIVSAFLKTASAHGRAPAGR